MSLQRLSTFVSSGVAFLLVCIKLIVWIISGSIAVLSSAIDSLLDFFVSVFNNIAVYYAEKSPDKKFNYWRWKIEAIASLFEWIIIVLSGLYVFYESISKLVTSEKVAYIWASIIVMIVSIIITFLLVLFLNHVARKTQDLVVKSDALHYKTDLFSNGWILLWLIIIKFTWFYHIDAIIWIIVAIYIVVAARDLIKNWFLLLLDVALSKEEVHKIKKIIEDTKNVRGYHKLKTRQSGNMKFVEVDLEFNDKMSLQEAHDITRSIVKKIEKIDTIYERDIYIHMDTEDDSK